MKKEYQKAEVKVYEMEIESALLDGSDTITIPHSEEEFDEDKHGVI